MNRALPILLPCLALLASCAAHPRGPYDPQREAARDPQRAQALTMRAAELMATDPVRAESLLREALTADLFHGPAHNNLGVLLLKKGELYSAAAEFQWAGRLLPGAADPRMNLALTLERAGRIDQALASYRSALDASPDHIPTIQAMTRLQLRAARPDDATRERLSEIALRGETDQWKVWAKAQLVKRD